eukprot:1010413-Pyramimonas_sp.AAC.2
MNCSNVLYTRVYKVLSTAATCTCTGDGNQHDGMMNDAHLVLVPPMNSADVNEQTNVPPCQAHNLITQ